MYKPPAAGRRPPTLRGRVGSRAIMRVAGFRFVGRSLEGSAVPPIGMSARLGVRVLQARWSPGLESGRAPRGLGPWAGAESVPSRTPNLPPCTREPPRMKPAWLPQPCGILPIPCNLSATMLRSATWSIGREAVTGSGPSGRNSMKVDAAVSGLDSEQVEAVARYLGMEGEPAGDVVAEMADHLADEAFRMLHAITAGELA
jgi:hypothetical protein